METIEAKVKKLINSSFIQKDILAGWEMLSLCIKNDNIHIYIDIRDFTTTCPKNKFSSNY